MPQKLSASFLEILKKEFPQDFTSSAPADLKEYGKDWTKIYTPQPSLIVFPRTTDEVARFLKLCHDNHIAVVPSGGRTGLAAGAVATQGEVVLSLKRMNRMDPVDLTAHTVRVQAGAITEKVHEHCAPHSLTWPVDFAAKGSSHIGGNIATNAGGVKVIRYGLTRQWVLGLQVVTAPGQVLELNGALEKNNTGYDLRQLFIGSEGTLGVITEATLKLAVLPEKLWVFFFAVSDLAAVLKLFRETRRGPFTIMAYEFLTSGCMDRVQQHRGLSSPFSEKHGCYVLLEVERPHSDDGLDTWLSSLFDKNLVADGVLAQSPREAAQLWSLRESVAESLFATGHPHKNDVSLPIHALEAFCHDLESFLSQQYPDWETFNFGHIGDGNLHINIMKPDDLNTEEFLKRTHDVDHNMFSLVRRHGGSISAEHGIGLLKKDYLSYSRTAVELEYFQNIKKIFDPHGILNPGKIFDLG